MLDRATFRLLERLYIRHLMTVGIGRVTASDDTGNAMALQVQLSANEIRDATTNLQHYGFGSHPLPGAQVTTLSVGGDRSNTVIIATGDISYRIRNTQPGEVWLQDNQGRSVYLTANGIVINGNGTPVTVQGDLHVTGRIISGYGSGDQVGLQTHTHTAPNGQTSAPNSGT